MSFVVAIDGPAGSGKGTITKIVGEKLGLVSLILGFSFFISPIYILRDDYTLGIYIVLLFLISIGAIISIKSILKKHLHEE